MKHGRFLKNVAVISLGGFIAKGIGALYRLPLTSILGGYGTGLYQMAYPMFCLLLTFSSAGIPSALSRLVAGEIARGRDGFQTAKTSLRLFALFGLCGSALMCLFAPVMSQIQGDVALESCYYALAPSVFFVATLAVLRGYFQGKNEMQPTAVSEIVEQLVKAGAGLFFALRFSETPEKAVAYTLFAVTASEFAALLCLGFRFFTERRRPLLAARSVAGTEIFRSVLPVMAASALLPLSQTADSVVIVRLLGSTERAVSLYGLYTGGALSLVNIPATVCYGIAAACVPSVSERVARGEWEAGRRSALYALGITLFLSLPCAAGLFFLATPVVSLLYPALAAEEQLILARLLRLSSVSAATLASVQTLSACLTGMGRARRAAFSMLLAVLVKLGLQFALVPLVSVSGAAAASNACYLVAFSLDLLYTVKKDKRRKRHDHDHRARRRSGRSLAEGARETEGSGRDPCPHGRAVAGKDA